MKRVRLYLPLRYNGFVPRTIYLDYNATTPLDPAVREAMLPFLSDVWGNPSSVHHVGRRARACLDDARERCAAVLGCKPTEFVFTSGGTESNNLAILGTARLLKPKGRHIITSAIEHHAVLSACDHLAAHEGFEVTRLPSDREGRIWPDHLRNAIRPDTILVSIMAANNEVGTIQAVQELGSICRDRGVIFHTDAVQWFGKLPFSGIDSLGADLFSLCAHKFHGPKGAGALFSRSPLKPLAILHGGAQENERRAGTENLAAVAGLTKALELFVRSPVFPPSLLQPLSDRLLKLADTIPGVHFVGPKSHRLPNTVAFAVQGADSVALLANLDLEGVCASSGSACSAGALQPSHVLVALGVELALSKSLLRFSFGRDSSMRDVEDTIAALKRIVPRAQTCE